MSDPDGRRTHARLMAAYGMIVGAAVGVLAGALDAVDMGWGILGGAAIGIVVGAVIGLLMAGD